MLQITDSAAELLRNAFACLDGRQSICLRLTEAEEEIRIAPGRYLPGDTVVKVSEETLLLLHPCVSEYLDGCTMDVDESTNQLVFT